MFTFIIRYASWDMHRNMLYDNGRRVQTVS